MNIAFKMPFLCLFSGLILLTACEKKQVTVQQTEVITDIVSQAEHKPVREFVGRLQAKEDINIQAKVTGYLLEHNFIEGEEVKKGDLLFVIDPDQYIAELSGAKAQIAQAQANVDITGMNYKRGKKLIKTNAISQLDMDNLTAKKLEAEANLKAAEAALKNAELNLQHTRITAPIDGRIGEKKHSIGDLINPQAGTLTTLVKINPIQASFQVNEKLFYDVGEDQRLREARGEDRLTFTVKIRLSSNNIYPHEGKLDFVSNRIDTDTGTLRVRAEFPNPDGLLRPGQYVKVLVEAIQPETLLTVPQAAILSDQQGDFVFTVDNAGIVKKIKVVLLETSGAMQFIESDSLKVNDPVIIAGLQKVRNGQTVKARSKTSTSETSNTPKAIKGSQVDAKKSENNQK